MKAIPMLFAGLFLIASTASAADPVARTEAFVNTLKTVKPWPEDGSDLTDADKKANTTIFEKLDGFLDFDTLVERSVASTKKKFKADQLATFKKDFSELIRLVAYANSGSFFKKAEYKLKLKKGKGKSADVIMDAYLAAEDFESKVTFHWVDSRIIDVSIDGSSLTKDYNAQFGRIISKGGVEDLLAKAKKRLDKEREEAIIAP